MSISDIIQPHIPYLIEEGFNLDWFARFKLILTPSANPGFFRDISFKNLTVYYDGNMVTLDNTSPMRSNLVLSIILINYNTTIRRVDCYDKMNMFSIMQKTEYENLKPIETIIMVNNTGGIIGNPIYKLSKLSGVELSEKLILKVEQRCISVYYNGNRVNKIIGSYRILVQYDENGMIRTVE